MKIVVSKLNRGPWKIGVGYFFEPNQISCNCDTVCFPSSSWKEAVSCYEHSMLSNACSFDHGKGGKVWPIIYGEMKLFLLGIRGVRNLPSFELLLDGMKYITWDHEEGASLWWLPSWEASPQQKQDWLPSGILFPKTLKTWFCLRTPGWYEAHQLIDLIAVF